jgi:hypothetical protein
MKTILCSVLLLYSAVAFSTEQIPDLDAPIAQLEYVLEEQYRQQFMNETVSNIAKLYEGKLYIVFHAYLNCLDSIMRKKQKLVQQDWNDTFQRGLNDFIESHPGGSIAAMEVGYDQIKRYKKRIATIEVKRAERCQ